MDESAGLGTLASTIEGINSGLGTFMQNDLNMRMKQTDRDQKLANAEKLMQDKQALANQNAPTVTAGHLIAANPAFKTIFGDSDPNTPVALDNIEKYKGIFPDSATGTGNANAGTSVDALDALLQLGDVDDDKRKEVVGALKKAGVRSLPTGIAENALKTAGGDVKTATAISILKDDPTFQTLDDDEKVAKVRSLRDALKGKGLKDLPDDQVDQVAQQSMDAYNAAVQNPKQFPDPEKAVAQELAKRYKDRAVNKVLIRVHTLAHQGGSPPPKKDAMGWIKKLYGG